MPSTALTIAASLFGGTALGISAVAFPFVSPAFRRICLPYVPATDVQVSNVLEAARRVQPKRVIDLGSGDGRVSLALHRELGLAADGAELNMWLLGYSRLAARRAGADCRFYRADMFKMDLGAYDCAVVFGTESMMRDVTALLRRTNVASAITCRFPLESGGLEHEFCIGRGIDKVWYYNLQSTATDHTAQTQHITAV